MHRLEHRWAGRGWSPLPRAYELDHALGLAEQTVALAPPESTPRRHGYQVRVVELATGRTVATYPKKESPGELGPFDGDPQQLAAF